MHKKIKIIFLLFVCCSLIQNIVSAKALIGEIKQDEFKITKPQVVDALSGKPIEGATVSIPTENKFDFTDNNGHFKISSSKNSPVILSIQKDGYRPFSLTLQDGKLKNNLQLRLEKSSPLAVVVTDNMIHLGDNSYSENSSGACQINAPCVGPVFSKDFFVEKITPNTKVYVTIGSVIGIDTIQAMKLGQNQLSGATSSPVELFVNKKKIGELKINGDNQKIPVPTNILNKTATNTLMVKTGINQAEKDYTDYDDIELMNLIVDVKN